MNLRTPYAFWLVKNGYVRSYPGCDCPKEADVAVVGAGITGALTAYLLAREGLRVVVIEKRHPGMGSTAASTALLQYEIDEPLHTLAAICGKRRAEDSYRACYEAIPALRRILHDETIDAGFTEKESLQYAAYKKDVPMLEKEFAARQKLGFDVSLLDRQEIHDRFGIVAPMGLLSSRAAQVDAYRMAHGLLAARPANMETYDCSEVTRIEEARREVRLHTGSAVIRARYAVLACGYETEKFLPFSCATIGTTYALVTKPLAQGSGLPDLKTYPILWDTKDPYLYVRFTPDNRIMAGGRDDARHNAGKRNRNLPRKTQGLLKDLAVLFPGISLTVDYAWAGAFAGTKDSLGYADAIPGKQRVFCNLGFGGNGILFSLVGGEILTDRILGRKNPYDDIFSFGR